MVGDSMDRVYLLQHSYDIEYEGVTFDETKIIGMYTTKEKAEEVVQRYKNIVGFNKYPIDCFCIDEYILDEDNWTEGFVSGHEITEDFEAVTSCINEWLGIQKTVEESWKDDKYYDFLWDVNKKVYDVKDANELAEHIRLVLSNHSNMYQNALDGCVDVAEKILNVLKLQ